MLGKIGKGLLVSLVVLGICGLWAFNSVSAADPPALARLTGAEKERVAKLIAGAKKEKELIAYSANWRPDVQEMILPVFRKEYGLSESDLKINVLSIRTGAVVTKVTEELRAKVYKTDIVNTAPASWFNELIGHGEIMAYNCPEYKYFSPLMADPKVGEANPPYFISSEIYPVGLTYNPKLIKGEIAHWKDVLKPEYKGKLIITDPSNSFSMTEAYLAIRKVVGRSYFEELGKMKPFILLSQSDLVNKCVSGEFPIIVMSTVSIAFRANEKGAGLKIVLPTEGWAAPAYPATILAHAPHPNAAKLFIDYFHGAICQDILMNYCGAAGGRKDLKSKHAYFPKPIEELKGAIEMDWRKVTNKDRDQAREEFRKLVKEVQ